MVKKLFFAAVLFLPALYFSFSQSDADYKMVSKNGFDLSWKVNGMYLDVKISAECTGWIAVGFDPKNKMKDANFILGYVKDGKIFTSDEFGIAFTAHKPDTELGGVNNIKNPAGFEKGDRTEISFSIPLNSGDKYDVLLSKGKHTLILACSGSDNFTSKHSNRTKVEIEIN